MRKQEVRTMNRFAYLSVMIVTVLALLLPSQALAAGATQFSGVAYYASPGQCTDPEGTDSDGNVYDYAVVMTGDLQGCHYTFIDSWVCSPGGGYNETGHEVFVGQYNGQAGTFRTTYRFTAKLKGCNASGEINGRCQHPIVDGSGTGVFDDMTGRLDMRDIVEPGVGGVAFPYRGHLYPVNSNSPG
jgi:hypothetical protein